jgi:hypothetical protein
MTNQRTDTWLSFEVLDHTEVWDWGCCVCCYTSWYSDSGYATQDEALEAANAHVCEIGTEEKI